MPTTYPLRSAALAQLGGIVIIGALAYALKTLAGADPRQIMLLLAMLQGGIAAMIALRQGAPRWWLGIHLGFMPLAVVVQDLDIEPAWFLGLFLLLLLVFWRTDKSRVPLYLTNRATAAELIKLLPAGPQTVIDLGCGEGSLLKYMALARPDCTFIGIEHAPLTWLLARLRNLRQANVTIRRGNFWQEPLGDCRLVYAFLSPTPMAELWAKVRQEMAPDALFVSNSFPVPGINAGSTIKVADRRRTRLFIYRPAR